MAKLERDLFYLENHRLGDAKLHDAILDDGDHAAAQKISDSVARAIGLTDAEIAALHAPEKKPARKRLRQKYSEDEPRDDRGRWTDGGGSGDGPSQAFVSPNIGNMTFGGAHAGLGSARQVALKEASADIDKAIGQSPAETHDVIGAWKDGAENSLMLKMPGWSHDEARAALAMKGWLGDQKSALLFTPAKDGNAFVASFPAKGDLGQIHQQLLDGGLEFHTLEPTSGGANVHVYGEDQTTMDKIGKAAGQYGGKAEVHFGNGEFIGTQKQDGTDREQRDDARHQYEAAIAEAAASPELSGRDLGKTWDTLRNRWGGILSQIGTQGAPLSAYSAGLKTTPGSGFGGAKAVKAGWIDASPIKSIPDAIKLGVEAQNALGKVGDEIAAKYNLPFKNPGPKIDPTKGEAKVQKAVNRVQDKAKERGGNIGAVTDLARATFLIDHPEQADQIISELSKHFEVAAEPWKVTPENYGDRSANVRLPNGVIAEIQMMHPAMADAKSPDGGGGHDQYVISRDTAPKGAHPDPVKYAAAVAKQREIYGKAYEQMPPGWRTVFGKAYELLKALFGNGGRLGKFF